MHHASLANGNWTASRTQYASANRKQQWKRDQSYPDHYQFRSRLQVDADSAAVAGGGLVDEREDPRGDGGPLDGKRRHQHVESDAAETIATQERHQETKTNEYHHMDILEDWEKIRWTMREKGERRGRRINEEKCLLTNGSLRNWSLQRGRSTAT